MKTESRPAQLLNEPDPVDGVPEVRMVQTTAERSHQERFTAAKELKARRRDLQAIDGVQACPFKTAATSERCLSKFRETD